MPQQIEGTTQNSWSIKAPGMAKPPLFTGTDADDVEPGPWLDLISFNASQLGPKDEWVRYAMSYLRTVPLVWALSWTKEQDRGRTNPSGKYDWDRFKVAFLERFEAHGKKYSDIENWMYFAHMPPAVSMTKAKGVQGYNEEFERLLSRVPSEFKSMEAIVMIVYIHGLPSRIKSQVLINEPTSWRKAADLARNRGSA